MKSSELCLRAWREEFGFSKFGEPLAHKKDETSRITEGEACRSRGSGIQETRRAEGGKGGGGVLETVSDSPPNSDKAFQTICFA